MIEGVPTLAQITSAGKVEDPTRPEPSKPAAVAELPKDVVAEAPTEERLRETLNVAGVPPASVALFHVNALMGELSLSWYEGGTKLLERRMQRPLKPLLEAPQGGGRTHPQSVLAYLIELRKDKALQAILQKLQRFSGAQQAQPSLVIIETTNTGIPWEMLPLPVEDDEDEETYLGARLATVRWDRIVDRLRNEDIPITFDAGSCHGRLITYVMPEFPDGIELSKVKHEQQAMEQLLRQRIEKLKQGASSFASLSELHAELVKKQLGVGVVYLLCHGTFEEEFMESSLGSLSKEEDKLTYAQLNQVALRLLRASKSLVFLDACSAGRAGEGDPRLTEHLRYGFPQLFLGHGAGAVIGAMDVVDSTYGGKVLSALLELASKPPATPIPELLRKLREEATRELNKAPADKERLADWYFTFVYVYYGKPMTTLAVAAAGAPP